jgi:hypothetical protein
MSNGNVTPLWQIATTFTATVGTVGEGILGRITSKGLLPVAVVDGGSGVFGNFYSNDTTPIARDATSKELGTIGFLYGLNVVGNDWEQLQSFAADADITASTIDNALGTNAFNFARDVASGNYTPATSDGTDADSVAAVTKGPLNSNGFNYAWNGATWDRVRSATVFKTVVATALGETTVWDPAAGKKIRLMGYTISVAGTLAATGVETIQLLDGNGGTVIKNHLATVTVTTPTGDTQLGADLGQGLVLTTDANLRIKLGTAMATGGVAINAWGTEE